MGHRNIMVDWIEYHWGFCVRNSWREQLGDIPPTKLENIINRGLKAEGNCLDTKTYSVFETMCILQDFFLGTHNPLQTQYRQALDEMPDKTALLFY